MTLVHAGFLAATLAVVSTSNLYAVDFATDIKPIFNEHCVACHGGVKQAGDVSFIYRDQALAVIEPGSPDDSVLIERVMAEDDDVRMPPADHGPPLSEHEIALLRTWIEEGAEWQSHWSFVSPKPVPIPTTNDVRWIRMPLDAFVLARLEQEGLSPSPEAEPSRWLRRVSLDLIGLPPTPTQRQDFLAAVETLGEAAYAAEVDRLLKSPHFGERWASVWLDAVRYADSKGLGQDGRRSIWKYRDWVIEALNRDMPFDEFTVAQLAGDLLPEPTLDDLIATGCHRLTQTNEEGGTDDEQFRLEAVIDRVNTTWQVWQGVTFGCVQCHSHPYDPIRHREYYQFLAFFNNSVDSDLDSDDPRIFAPIDPQDDDRAKSLDRQISDLKLRDWQTGYAMLADDQRWRTFSEMAVSTSAETQLAVESIEGVAQFHTVGTVAQKTDIVIDVAIPNDMSQVTAVRFTGMPLDPDRAKADSEWGFVLSYVEAFAVVGDGEPEPLEISRVIGDDPAPLFDPQLSLDSRSSQGFGAYSRIHHPRTAVFVLASPLPVGDHLQLRLKLRHDLVETGAFPLVTRRGTIAVTDDPSFVEWQASPETRATEQQIEQLVRERLEIQSVRTPVMQERTARLARPTHIFERGNFLNKGDQVQPATPEFLPPLSAANQLTRLDLAHWIARRENPLTARVAVNRWWAQMFGVGIVETQEDFGSSGAAPSHPELLDDLALRFSGDMGWSLKSLLREMALSSTYRQTSKVTPEQLQRDPRNRLFGRASRTRLSAEIVRDQALAISGLLSPEMFGPPVHPPLPPDVWKPFQGGDQWDTPGTDDPDRYRRSVYTYTKRTIPFPMFAAFDAPSREFCTARRLPSNTPLQALMTLNDQSFAEASHALAAHMLAAGETIETQIEAGFLRAVAREPDASELSRLCELFEQTRQQVADQPDSNKLAMSNVATVLLNLDEVLSK